MISFLRWTPLLVLFGCAATGPAAKDASAPTLSDDGSFALTRVAESALPAGKCGMILWTLDERAPVPIFRYVAGETALVSINGAAVDLTLAETRGGGDYGVFEEQVFVGGAGYDARVVVNFGLGFEGGTYLERGVITVRSDTGWEIVAPTAGIAGCRKS
ncbi:MAG: hypothetical protein AAFW81_06030 [Pseudomonadota bacterium]